MDLYVFRKATTSRAVMAFCDLEGVEVTVRDVDILRGEHHAPPFAALNPNRLVPVLVDDHFVLTEASAILRYLAGKTRSSLYPEALRPRAMVDERVAWFEANFYKDFGFQYVYPQILPNHARGSVDGTRQTVAWGREKSRAWLAVLDQHFLGDGRTFLVGGALTIADLLGVSIVSLGELVGCDFADSPNVARWYRAVTSLPSWERVNGPFAGFAASLRGREYVSLS